MRHSWPQVRLAEVLRQVSEAHRVEAHREYPNFGIYSFGRGLFRKQPISGATTSATTLYRVKKSQFVYSRLFAFEGAYGLVTDEFDSHFVSNEYPTFETNPDRLLTGFLAAYFRWPEAWERVGRMSVGMGHRRQRVQPVQFLQHEIPLPPLVEQQGVVARFDEVERRVREALSVRERSNDDLVHMLRASFASIARDAPRKLMSEVAPLVRRPVEVDALASYPELGIRSFGKGTFHKPAIAGLDVGSKRLYRIDEGDLLFSNVFAWEGAVAVATAGDAGRYGSHRFITCIPRIGHATSRWLCFYFLTPEGLEKLGRASPGGAGRNRTLGLDALGQIDVPVPPIEHQRWFDTLRDEADAVRHLQGQAGIELDALVPSLLAHTFEENSVGR